MAILRSGSDLEKRLEGFQVYIGRSGDSLTELAEFDGCAKGSCADV